jgi:hypothetical protein
MATVRGIMGLAASAVALTALSAASVPAAGLNIRPVSVAGTALQDYFTSVGQSINVNTSQVGTALWTTTLSGNSTFTIKLALGSPSTHAIGLYSDGASSTHYQIFPSWAGPGWFTVTSFDVGTKGHVVSNLFNENALWQSSSDYYGVNSQAFGFYIDQPSASLITSFSEDDENPGEMPMNVVYAATGSSVGSWWLAFQAAPHTGDGEYKDALVFLESVNLTSPALPSTWGKIKNLYAP